MKRKLLFFTNSYSDDFSKTGIGKKIKNQFDELSVFFEESYISGEEKNQFIVYGTKHSVTLGKLFLKRNKRIKLALKMIEDKEVTDVYIRYTHFADRNFVKFLAKLKEKKCNVILEIPTFPYDKEYKKELTKTYLLHLIEKNYRKKMRGLVDYIVTFSDDQEIFGIPCINISNGINLSEISLSENKISDTFVFSSVSSLEPWHGIDRFLYSLESYIEKNQNKKLIFNIVGKGSEMQKLENIVKESCYLQKVVNFHGFKTGYEIDDIYDMTDIAIGSLGRHRSGLTSLKTLKNREYAAKGIPMVYSEIDPDFEGQPFVYKVTPDEESINIEEIINWYQNLEVQPEKIREYSKKFSWNIQMKKVIDAIEEK